MEKKIDLLLATQNKKKYKEFFKIFKFSKVVLKSLTDFSNYEPNENGSNFKENAYIKVNSAIHIIDFRMNCISDDSGLCIDALAGRPGIHSARWAPNGSYKQAYKKIKYELEKIGLKMDGQKASFICIIAFMDKKKNCKYYEGLLNGELTYPPRGNKGFGYDPIFIPNGYNNTLAELSDNIKNKISHRKIAVTKFIDDLI